jgi:flagellar hook-associated protein 3 FlgL
MAAITRPTFLGTNRAIQQRLTSAYDRYNDQADRVASNRRFRRASEDPVAASQAAMLQEHLDHLQAVAKSSDDASARLNITDAKLTQASDSYNRIHELLLQAANGTVGPDGRAAIAHELTQIRDGLVALANSDYLGSPLFAGLSGQPAVSYDTGTGSWVFNGDATDVIERRISPTESLRVNTTAAETFQSASTDIYTMLDDAVDALDAGDLAGITTSITSLEELRNSLFGAHALIGAAANRVTTAADRNSATQIAVENQLSLVRDVDLAEAITQQKMYETAYQAALSVTGRTMNLSILDYLR